MQCGIEGKGDEGLMTGSVPRLSYSASVLISRPIYDQKELQDSNVNDIYHCHVSNFECTLRYKSLPFYGTKKRDYNSWSFLKCFQVEQGASISFKLVNKLNA